MPLAAISRALGTQTNNVAEYTGVLLALRLAQRLGAAEVDLILDSNLVVEQVNLRWKVRDAKLKPLFAEVRRLLAAFHRWSAVHEPRERNRAADALWQASPVTFAWDAAASRQASCWPHPAWPILVWLALAAAMAAVAAIRKAPSPPTARPVPPQSA
jgi:hypothetical protein